MQEFSFVQMEEKQQNIYTVYTIYTYMVYTYILIRCTYLFSFERDGGKGKWVLIVIKKNNKIIYIYI